METLLGKRLWNHMPNLYLWYVVCPLAHAMLAVAASCLGTWASKHSPGTRLFENITSAAALLVLRSMLATVGVEQPFSYRTHDLRRGSVFRICEFI